MELWDYTVCVEKIKLRYRDSLKRFYIINEVLQWSLNIYSLMKCTKIYYLSLAKLLEIAEIQRGDELTRRKETLGTT